MIPNEQIIISKIDKILIMHPEIAKKVKVKY